MTLASELACYTLGVRLHDIPADAQHEAARSLR